MVRVKRDVSSNRTAATERLFHEREVRKTHLVFNQSVLSTDRSLFRVNGLESVEVDRSGVRERVRLWRSLFSRDPTLPHRHLEGDQLTGTSFARTGFVDTTLDRTAEVEIDRLLNFASGKVRSNATRQFGLLRSAQYEEGDVGRTLGRTQ